ncbi:MAG: zinc ribbon domain-containing protein [Ruminiclostridium sp.]|nr:zinc ribbon domain-containing protein [Ruminiclostridium sp.]
MAKFCSNCGSPLAEGMTFCGECGEKVMTATPPEPSAAPVQPPAPANETKFCPGCGHSLNGDALFCGYCGYRYGAAVHVQQTPPPPPSPQPPVQQTPPPPPLQPISAAQQQAMQAMQQATVRQNVQQYQYPQQPVQPQYIQPDGKKPVNYTPLRVVLILACITMIILGLIFIPGKISERTGGSDTKKDDPLHIGEFGNDYVNEFIEEFDDVFVIRND